MDDEKCETCRFWLEDGRDVDGRCGRRSPDHGLLAQWPSTIRDDWCGDWEKKEDFEEAK